MRLQIKKRVNVMHGRMTGGLLNKKPTNLNKLSQDFERIYITPKRKHVKKFTLGF